MIRDITAALGLLTRLPAGGAAPRPAGAWAWPLAGVAVGAIMALVAAAAQAAGLPPGAAAVLVLAAGALSTGALHEDGLADCADGFWGGRDKERRLAIMKDSRIGAYGTLALILVILFRWQAIAGVLAGGSAAPLIAAAALSRAPMAVLSALMPNARGSGLSQSVGRPAPGVAAAAVAVALVAALVTAGGDAGAMALAAAAATLGVALIARAKIGGQTGDVLGAAQQLAEAAALGAAAALIAP